MDFAGREMMKVRGQNYAGQVGCCHLEQTQDGSWYVKIGANKYLKGIFDTKEDAEEARKAWLAKKSKSRRKHVS